MESKCMTLEDFAELYPDEYNDYVDDMAEMAHDDEILDYPEDWAV